VNNDRQPQAKALRVYRKRVELFRLLNKIKLWPSRRGVLHGIRSIAAAGQQAEITTHCGRTFSVRDSRNSRAARWLRNQWFQSVCPECRVPDWKLEKYSTTRFKRKFGSLLSGARPAPPDEVRPGGHPSRSRS
jgi:pyrrolysyl-tRNA synthetase-like protein